MSLNSEARWRKAGMRSDWRCTLLRLLMLGTIVLTTASFASPVGVRAADMPRVRSSSAFIRGVIDDAIEASPTFRKLVTTIGGTDGIVYVEQGTCRHGVRACLSLSVTQSAGFRFLRILINLSAASTRKGRLDLIGTIGHELWHALEVLADRTLTTVAAIFQFYAREALTGHDAFETEAAVSAGARIRHEVGERVTLVKGVEVEKWRQAR
jgi:hypothetical protein